MQPRACHASSTLAPPRAVARGGVYLCRRPRHSLGPGGRHPMQEVFIVEAVRSPIGRRKGGLAGLHPADLLGAVQKAAVERAKVDPREIGQIVGGCVSQVGEQTFNIARTAWLAQGLPLE